MIPVFRQPGRLILVGANVFKDDFFPCSDQHCRYSESKLSALLHTLKSRGLTHRDPIGHDPFDSLIFYFDSQANIFGTKRMTSIHDDPFVFS